MSADPGQGAGSPIASALAELHDRWPQRMVPDVDRITDLLDILGSPQRAFPSIHLTGTNGKTSTARMIDALLRAHDLRTGRYTSPDLQSVAERITIGGDPVTMDHFAAVHEEILPFVQMVDSRHADRMTYFEVLTGMAFAAFADAPVDVGVIEVGLGGRWDATNVIDAPVVVITPISLDHTALLGKDVETIAAEKSAIITAGAVAVVGEQQLEALEVILRRCTEVGASVAREGLEFGVAGRSIAVGGQLVTLQGLSGTYDDIFLPLHGAHQAHNAACALAAFEAFLGRGPDSPLDLDIVRAGFAIADSPGRLEIVRSGPTMLLDGAHNPASATALVDALEEAFAFQHLVGVVAILADKDAEQMLEILEPVLATIVCTSNGSPRALPAGELGELAVDIFGEDRVVVEPTLSDALARAVDLVEDQPDLVGTAGGGVLITGSLVTVGEARTLLLRGQGRLRRERVTAARLGFTTVTDDAERTLILVKPDGVRRGLVGEIISRLERKGLTLGALELRTLAAETAKAHYGEHEGKPFFDGLVEFITGGPLVAMVVEGPSAIRACRVLMGVTNPVEAAPGSIRGDFALEIGENLVHGSDSPEAAAREIGLFFPDLG